LGARPCDYRRELPEFATVAAAITLVGFGSNVHRKFLAMFPALCKVVIRYALLVGHPHPVGRVVDHHRQHALDSPPFKPVMGRTIQLHHRPKAKACTPAIDGVAGADVISL
jgi:hypothetical protein